MPRLTVRLSDIDVTAPDPRCLVIHKTNEPGGLWVVNDYHIMTQVCKLGKLLIGTAVQIKFLLRKGHLLIPLKGVVKLLGHFKEFRRAVKDAPVSPHTDIIHQKNQIVEDFRHTAAEGGSVHVHHSGTGQFLRLFPDLGQN